MSAETLTDLLDERPTHPSSNLVSYEEFLSEKYEGIHAEWVNGEVIAMSPVTMKHQNIGSFLISLLTIFVQSKDAGVVSYEPFQMKIGPDLPGRSPDILFVDKAHLDRIHSTYLDGPADLVVEIVSPESGPRDRGDKYFEYERGAIREYWLIDPQRRTAEFYRLGSRGVFEVVPIESDLFRSTVLEGFWINVNWLWMEPLPPLLPTPERMESRLTL